MALQKSQQLVLILRIACTAEILAKSYKLLVLQSSPVLGLVILAGLFFVWTRQQKWGWWGLLSLSFIFLIQAITKFIDSSYQLAQLIELSLQISLPALLAVALYQHNEEKLYGYFRLAIALTFLGHGWYALGFIYPQPSHFVDMTVSSLSFLGMTPDFAAQFLIIAGVLDMLVAIGMFFPKYYQVSAGYATIWGFLTSAARIASYVRFSEEFWLTLSRYLPEFLIRVPHFAVPFLVYKQPSSTEEDKAVPAILES